VPQWTVSADGKRIARTFTFKDFVQAMKFVNKVADVAEAQGHHPDIHIHWEQGRAGTVDARDRRTARE